MNFIRAAKLIALLGVFGLLVYLCVPHVRKGQSGQARQQIVNENAAADQAAFRIRHEIAEGRYVQARRQIEQQLKQATPQQMDELHLLLGLSYLKEAEDKPQSVALPYDKLAFYYFKSLPLMSERYSADRAEILKTLVQRMQALIQSHTYQGLSIYSGMLESWNAREELAQLQSFLNAEAQTLEKLSLARHPHDLGTPQEALQAMPSRSWIPSKQAILARLEWMPEVKNDGLLSDFPEDTRSSIQRLMRMGRYDLALQLWRSLEKDQPLSPEDKADYSAVLVHQGKTEEAQWKAQQWFAQTPHLPPAAVANIALNLQMPFQALLVALRMNVLPSTQNRSLAFNKALFNLWIQSGDYQNARDLAAAIRPDLEASADGLMLLARLSKALSREKEAHAYARKALRSDPSNADIRTFIAPFEMDPDYLSRRLQALRLQIIVDPSQIALKLDLAQVLIDSALSIHQIDPSLPLKKNPELGESIAILNQLAASKTGLPRLFLLQGETAWLLGEEQTASEAFKKALKLDGSNVEAYKYQAMLEMDIDQPQRALGSLKAAAAFAPQDPEVWHELARVSRQLGNSLDALDCLAHVVRYKPNDPEGYIDTASIQLELQNPESALLTLETALKLSPKNTRALKLRLKAFSDLSASF